MTALKVARGFTLPASYITKTAAVLAKKRIGKTYNASVIAEEMFAAGLPFVALDPTSAWWGLRASADGTKDGLAVTIIGGDHGDLPLDVGSGKAIADLVVDEPGFYVIDLGHWENDSEHRRWAAPFLDRIYRYKAKHRDPLHLFIDEADVFAPQKPQRGDEQMLHNMQAIVRRGGIRGLGTTLITQRAAVLNKDVLTQLDLLVILRTIAPQDQDAVENYIKRGAAGQREEIMDSLASLKAGEAWVYGPGEEPPIVERVQFRKRRTFNSSATPEGSERVEPKKMAPVDLEKARERLADAIEKQKAEDPKLLQARLKAATAELDRIAGVVGIKPGEYAAGELPSQVKQLHEAAAAQAEPKTVEVEVKVPVFPRPLRDEYSMLLEGVIVKAQSLIDRLDAEEDWDPNDFGAGAPTDARSEVRQPASAPGGRSGARREAPPRVAPPPRTPVAAGGSGPLPPARQKVVDAVRWFEVLGISPVSREALAPLADSRATSGGFKNNLGGLRTEGLLDYPVGNHVQLTEAGRATANEPDIAPTTAGLQDAVLNVLPPARQKILIELIGVYPGDLTRQDLAERIEVPYTSGGFKNNLGAMNTAGFITYPAQGHVAAADLLFPTLGAPS